MSRRNYLKDYGTTLIDNGYSIVPIPPASKHPKMKGWQTISSTHKDVDTWVKQGFEGIGILAKNTLAIDIDILDEAIVNKLCKYIKEHLSVDALFRVGKHPKVLIPVRSDKPKTKVSSNEYIDPNKPNVKQKIEILADGQQWLAFGIHPDTKSPYQWSGEVSILDIAQSDLPVISDDFISGLFSFFNSIVLDSWVKSSKKHKTTDNNRANKPSIENLRPPVGMSVAEVKRILSLEPIKQKAIDYHSWIDGGMALHHEFDGSDEGLALFREWSHNYHSPCDDEITKKWHSFKDELTIRPRTLATILDWQKAALTNTSQSIEDKLTLINKFTPDGDLKKANELLRDIGNLFVLFHDEQQEGYAKFYDGQKIQVFKINSGDFDDKLRYLYFKLTSRGVNKTPIADAVATISAIAKYEGQQEVVYKRVGYLNGNLYINIGDGEHFVQITSNGWEVIRQSPINFLNSKCTSRLPIPVKGGDKSQFFDLINVRDEEKPLVWGWLLGAFQPTPPYPILVVMGTQGSGKSTLTRMLRSLTDPSVAMTTAKPKDEKDLISVSLSGYVVALDNLSFIENDLSDTLCRIAYGETVVVRDLYTTADAATFKLANPLIINGINNPVSRPDLLSRSIVIDLPPIDTGNDEGALQAKFERNKPYIFGALCGDLVNALAHVGKTSTEKLPRLAKFARWCCAAEYGKDDATFIEAYRSNINRSVIDNLENDIVALAVQKLAEHLIMRGVTQCHANATELLEALERHGGVSLEARRTKFWPKDAPRLGKHMSRIETSLKNISIIIVKKRINKQRFYIIDLSNYHLEAENSDCDRKNSAGDNKHDCNEGSAVTSESIATKGLEEDFNRGDSSDSKNGKTFLFSFSDGNIASLAEVLKNEEDNIFMENK
jgi:energy-coupling factor transporter ATP-binding protein EcfA2